MKSGKTSQLVFAEELKAELREPTTLGNKAALKEIKTKHQAIRVMQEE